MPARLLSLLLASFLAWFPAGTLRHARQSALGGWESALASPATPAPAVHLPDHLRTLGARPGDRRHAPPGHGPAPALRPVEGATVLRAEDRAARPAPSRSSASELTFPYDATAPPAIA